MIDSNHLKRVALLISALMIGTVFMHELHVSPWPAFLAVVFYFAFGFDNSTLKTIFFGATTGLVLGLGLAYAMPWAVEAMGSSLGYYVVLAAALAIILVFGAVAHDWFNPVSFAYGLLCLLNLPDVPSQFVTWFLTFAIGGTFIVACVSVTVHKIFPKLGL